nr:MAG TPA: hypothetical protein [Caudoviricetes sp.]
MKRKCLIDTMGYIIKRVVSSMPGTALCVFKIV